MQRIIDFFRGTFLVSVEGAWPERAINRLSENNLPFRQLQRSKNRFTFRIYRCDFDRASSLCTLEGCEMHCEKTFGLRHAVRGLRGRFALMAGLLAVLFATLFLQKFIWTMEVQGNETLQEEQILQALEQIGLHVGSYIRTIDPQEVKNQMLRLLPELEWISVNKRGGHATILVHERDVKPEIRNPRLTTNIVAAKAGVITEMQVYSGFPVKEKGQAVLAGELLVSGLGTGWREVIFRNAQAEVYALTRYETTFVLPEESIQRSGSGKEKTLWSLQIGKKRWNFNEESGISLTGYDKIERVHALCLPGGVTLPIAVIETTILPYEAQTVSLDEDDAFSLLSAAEQRYTESHLLAGTVEDTQAELQLQNGVYRYHALTQAREMIARAEPVNPLEQ